MSLDLAVREKIIRQTEILLIDFIEDFQQNPFEYFYEEDIRAVLLIKLKSSFKNIFADFPTLSYAKQIKSSFIKSSIIKAEYPSYKRFDIAFLSHQQDKDFYNQPIFMAIEIKLGSHNIGADKTAGFKSDIIKLEESYSQYKKENFIGVAIYFCQTPVKQDDIVKWYGGTEFQEIEKKEIVFEDNNIYALLVPSEKQGKIFLSKINIS
jgi:hypothetical protein